MRKLRKISKTYYLRQIVACLLVYCILLAVPMQVVLANPAPGPNAHPSAGTFGIDYTATLGGTASWDLANTTTINVLSNGTVFDWQNFDIGNLQNVVHTGMDSTHAVLHRINVTAGYGDTFATGINGDLSAPGYLFVVNPMGIVMGADAMITANRFVASGLNISNFSDFTGGVTDELQFEGYDVSTLGVELQAGGEINASAVALIGKTVLNDGTIDSESVVLAAGERVYLAVTDDSGKLAVDVTDLLTTVPSDNTVTNTGTIIAPGGNVLLAAGDIYSLAISGVEDLAAVANRDIILDDNIQAGEIAMEAGRDVALASGNNMTSTLGDLSVTAGRDIMLGDDLSDSDPTVGAAGDLYANGDMILNAGDSIYAHGELETDTIDDGDGFGANINLYASGSNTIHLYGDVTADVYDGGDIILHNRSEVAHDVTLMAGDDVRALDLLEAQGDLTIVAAGGEIEVDAVNMMADDSLLSLTQNVSLNMEQALDDVFNSGETYLFAKSTGGSVSSSKADTWKSIEAEAQTFINLDDSDTGGNITTNALTATDGDILITSNLGKVYANGPINAGQDVKITAKNESSDSIFLSADVEAGRDILLNNNTRAYDGAWIDAGRDVKVGYDEYLDVYYSKTLTGDGELNVEADRHITLGGAVAASDTTPGDLLLKADDGSLGGDMTAYSTIDNPGGNIDIYSSDGTTYLYNNVTAGTDLTLHNDTMVAGDNRQLSAGRDLTLADDKTLDAVSGLWLEADRDLTLGGPVTASVVSLSNLHLHADGDADGIGNMHAKDTVTNDGGWTHIKGVTIDLDGAVSAGNYLEIVASEQGTGGVIGNVTALSTLTAGGNIDITADDDIDLQDTVNALGNVTVGNITLVADAADSDTVGDVDAEELIAAGTIDISASDTTINLHNNVTVGGDILLRNNTVADADVVLTAGDDVALAGGKTLAGLGALSVQATGDIVFGVTDVDNHETTQTVGTAGHVSANGNLELTAGDDIYAHGTLTTTSTGDIDGLARNITAYDSVNSAGALFLTATDDITLEGSADSAGVMWLRADFEQPKDNVGDVWAKSSLNSASGGLGASGENITVDGTTDSGAWISMTAENNITLGDDATAGGSIVLTAGQDIMVDGASDAGGWINMTAGDNITLTGLAIADTAGSVATEMEGIGIRLMADAEDVPTDGVGDVVADSSLTTTAGDIVVSGQNVTVNGAISSADDLSMTARNNLNLGDDAASVGNMVLTSDDDDDDSGDVVADGNLTAGGNIDIYSSDNTTILGGDLVQAVGNVTLHNNTELNGGALQRIEATTGKLTTKGYVRKTTAGNLEMFGGYNSPIFGPGWNQFSVSTKEVTVDDGATDGELSITGNAFVWLDGDIYSRGDMTLASNVDADISGSDAGYMHHDSGTIQSLNGDIDISASGSWIHLYGGNPTDYVTAGGDILLRDSTYVTGDRKLDAGDDFVLAGGKYLSYIAAGTLTVEAGDDIILGSDDVDNHWANKEIGTAGDVTANGDLILTAGDNIYAHGLLETVEGSGGNITAMAEDHINLYNTPTSANADGTLTLIADNDDNDTGNLTVDGALYGNMYLNGVDVTVSGDVESDGTLDVDADDEIVLRANVSSVGEMTMDAGSDIELNRDSGNTSSDSTITLNAGDSITIGRPFSGDGNVTANGNMDIIAGTDSVDDVKVFGKLTTTNGGNINVQAGDDIKLYGTLNDTMFESAQAAGNLTLTAGDDVDVLGDLISNTGNIEIYSSDNTTYLGGDRVQAFGNILLNNNTEFDGDDDQKVDAQTGMITANGWLYKEDGSLYLEAAGDVSLADYVTADFGGVSIISENGRIFTPDEFGDPTDTLNVAISGYSDQAEGIGVELPLDPDQKAAIVLISKEDLKLGADAALSASGVYDNTGAVDDRAAIDLLDDGDPAVATIGGILRDEGDPFDVAIYAASTDGDVDISSPVSIMSGGEIEGPPPVPQGAMVIDALDTVTFGALFESSLASGDVGDRLEVVSRITEWLYQAIGRLPYVYGGGPFPADYAYVLRGAGLDNPGITDGRAWVLEDPLEAAPLSQEAGQAAEEQILGLDGCPVLIAAASVELGIPSETIEVSLANSYALNTDIQPCESCARLLDAAVILTDEDGSNMAAMNQVFNELAPAGAPFTPEVAASIVTAFAGRVNDGTQYATAIEYVDAFVQYIAVLNSEMGSPTGDSVAFVMQKYGSGVTGSDNANLAAFVAARLEAGETFSQ